MAGDTTLYDRAQSSFEGTAVATGLLRATSKTLASAQEHDFLKGLDVYYLGDDVSAGTSIDLLAKHVAKGTEKNPVRLTVDTETCGTERIRDEYKAASKLYDDCVRLFDNFPAADKTPDPEKALRKKAQSNMKDAHNDLKAIGKKYHKAGLKIGDGEVRLIQIFTGKKAVFVFDMFYLSAQAIQRLYDEVLGVKTCVWLGHNIIFDVNMLGQMGMVPHTAPHCTLLLDHVMTSNYKRRTLAALCAEYINKNVLKELQASDWGQPVLSPEQVAYAAADVVATHELFEAEREKLAKLSGAHPDANYTRAYQLTRAAIPAVSEMVVNGLPFDEPYHQILLQDLATNEDLTRADLLKVITQVSVNGAPKVENPNSSKQIASWLTYQLTYQHPFSTNNWPKTTTGQMSTSKDDITISRSVADASMGPFFDAYLAYSSARKYNSDWGKPTDAFISRATGRCHANIRIAAAETGRFSITDPPMQTTPRTDVFRKLVAAPPGKVIIAQDLGQIEVRVAAALSGDRVLLKAIDQGLDVHALTACACFSRHPDFYNYSSAHGSSRYDPHTLVTDQHLMAALKDGQLKWMRQAAKACIFGLIFGQGAAGLQRRLAADGIQLSKATCVDIQTGLLDLYPGLRQWITNTRAAAERTGYIWTPGGRHYSTPKSTYTKSINTPCQGGAAEIMLRILAYFPQAWRKAGLEGKAHLALTVHDELLAVADQDIAAQASQLIQDVMVKAVLDLFPNIPTTNLVDGGYGATWADAK